jgi:hypothetical protein
MKSLYLIIDTLALDANGHDATLYLENKIPMYLQKVGLKSITIYASDVSRMFKSQAFDFRHIFIHCDIINKDNNLFNNTKTDIVAIIGAVNPSQMGPLKKSIIFKFEQCLYKSLKSTDFTSIRMYLTSSDTFQSPTFCLLNETAITYELHFIE